jgi:pimeloyl-ACP methyl ester carboxylesterase
LNKPPFDAVPLWAYNRGGAGLLALICLSGRFCRLNMTHLVIHAVSGVATLLVGAFLLQAAMPPLPAGAQEPASNRQAAESAAPPATIIPHDYLVIPAVGQYGRMPLHRDAVEAQLVRDDWEPPAAGNTLESPDGDQESWRAATADENGTLKTPRERGGWAATTFDSPTERVMLLEAAGHATVFVNGEPRAGDPYRLGWLRMPVLVRPGRNTLLFHLAGDNLSARLTVPPAGRLFTDTDHTLPTLIRGERATLWGAVPLINASTEWLDDGLLVCRHGEDDMAHTPVAPIPPLSVRKVAFQIPAANDEGGDHVHFQLRLVRAGEGHHAIDGQQQPRAAESLAESSFALRIVGSDDIHIRTFRSTIDGSVQPYAVRPASDRSPPDPPGIIVALHDAAVSCEDHAARFAAKPWAHVVVPQGRRPYGFDWEAWGRIDVLESLRDARNHYPNDPRRTYLTGHSMGGHGAWHLGVTYPDQFAAIGPSSGWASFWSYGGGMPQYDKPTDIESLLVRGYSASDTLRLLENLSHTGVYLLHGSNDESVPIEQARFMRERLADFHRNFAYFEQPGAGHWWGDECCDWPRMMEFFRHLSLPEPAAQSLVDFITADPGVSSRCHWVSIEAQQEQRSPSRVTIRQNPQQRTFVGETANVTRLTIDVDHLPPNQPIDVKLDGQSIHWIPWPHDSHKLWFARQDEQWAAVDPVSPQLKGPNRYGTFNAVFNNHALLVYGTGGTEEENDWAQAKARYDAETFYYRGGGTLEVLPDARFDLNRDTDRNVVLYGNADTNRAWPMLLATSPVEVKRGEARVGERVESGHDLAVVMARPRPGSDTAMVGVVGGSGAIGMRLTNRLRWFVSGIVYPDLMILGPNVLSEATAGVRAWGYFGADWQIDSGDIAWQNAPL